MRKSSHVQFEESFSIMFAITIKKSNAGVGVKFDALIETSKGVSEATKYDSYDHLLGYFCEIIFFRSQQS